MIKKISSMGIVISKGGQVLLLNSDGEWVFPKGHVEHGEDYVEAILVLYKKFGSVRSVDIARHMEVLSELYTLTKDFCNVIFSKNAAKLDEWINTAQKYDIPEFQTFINGVKKDLTAVKNGIIYSYNNGLQKVV